MWDYIIIGAGSAGCVLANRLSADPKTKVLLIEAGADLLPGEEPEEIKDLYPYRAAFNPGYQWPGLKVYFQPLPHNNPERPPLKNYGQARVVGGGSSINGELGNRGTPDDYDEWAELGATGWDWASVLPYFKKLENDLDFSGPLHGAQGPIDVSRVPVTVWPGFTQAAANAFTQAGYTNIEDQNGRFEDGWFPAALSASRQQRRSAAMGYLDLATRSRPNLSIRTGTHVHQLQREGLRIVGVSVDCKAERAHRVILSAGALQSPAFLLRTGIGPAQQLRDLGIDVVADRQGVGANLQEHPSIAMSAWIRPHARLGDVPRRHVQMALRYTSDIPGSPPSDMYTVVVSKSAWHPIGRRLGSLFTWINKPYSKGSLKLISADPGTYPEVAFELLSDPRDLARMKAAMVKMWMHFQSASLKSAASDPFAATHGAMAAAVGKTTFRNWLMTIGPALLMDGPAALRQLVIRRLLAPGSDFAKAIADDDALTAIVRHHTIGGWHASGTCRMGSADDAHAVVSPHDGSVHGVEGLHVIDASVMPCVPRANTNFPTIMIAEKMAAQLLVRAQQ